MGGGEGGGLLLDNSVDLLGPWGGVQHKLLWPRGVILLAERCVAGEGASCTGIWPEAVVTT